MYNGVPLTSPDVLVTELCYLGIVQELPWSSGPGCSAEGRRRVFSSPLRRSVAPRSAAAPWLRRVGRGPVRAACLAGCLAQFGRGAGTGSPGSLETRAKPSRAESSRAEPSCARLPAAWANRVSRKATPHHPLPIVLSAPPRPASARPAHVNGCATPS